MGNLRDEMTKVLNEWDKADEQLSQPTMENTMTTESTERTTDTSPTKYLIHLLTTTPNLTNEQVRQHTRDNKTPVRPDLVATLLSQLTRRGFLSRKPTGETHRGHPVFTYTANTEDERKRLITEAANKLKAARARAARAREVKAEKQAAREALVAKEQEFEERTGLRDLLPPSVATTSIYNTKPAPSPAPWTASYVINSLNALQARELYDELKKIFGR